MPYNRGIDSFHAKKLRSRFYMKIVTLHLQSSMGALGAMYAVHLGITGKPIADFLNICNN